MIEVGVTVVVGAESWTDAMIGLTAESATAAARRSIHCSCGIVAYDGYRLGIYLVDVGVAWRCPGERVMGTYIYRGTGIGSHRCIHKGRWVMLGRIQSCRMTTASKMTPRESLSTSRFPGFGPERKNRIRRRNSTLVPLSSRVDAERKQDYG